MKEIWKDIAGYEGRYQVSNLGNVKSMNYGRTKKEGVMKAGTTSQGYFIVILYNHPKKQKGCTVHRLVAKSFIENPENKRCVNHKNGIKTDNRLENLTWATHSENNQHAYDTGLSKGPIGDKHWCSKLTWDIVKDIRRLYASGKFTMPELADKFKVHTQSIWNIVNNKTWKVKGVIK